MPEVKRLGTKKVEIEGRVYEILDYVPWKTFKAMSVLESEHAGDKEALTVGRVEIFARDLVVAPVIDDEYLNSAECRMNDLFEIAAAVTELFSFDAIDLKSAQTGQ